MPPMPQALLARGGGAGERPHRELDVRERLDKECGALKDLEDASHALGLPRPRRGCQVPLDGQEQEIRDDGEQRGEDRADDHARGKVAADAGEDQLSQATAADVCPDSRDADYGYARYAHAGDDDRQCQRKLDLEENLAGGKTQSARGVFSLLGYRVHPGDDVADQDEERVRDERDDDCPWPEPDAGDGDEQREGRQARDGEEEPGDERDRRVGLAVARDEYTGGQRDNER